MRPPLSTNSKSLRERKSSVQWKVLLKDNTYFIFLMYMMKFLYEVILIWTKVKLGKKRSTIGCSRNVDCLLKLYRHKKVFNQEIKHLENVSDRETESWPLYYWYIIKMQFIHQQHIVFLRNIYVLEYRD